MDRRTLLKLGPAFPAAAVTASLVLKETGMPPVELDVSVLKTQPGDVLVLSTDQHISAEVAQHIRDTVESRFPHLKAMVMSGGLILDGVIRTGG